jgi:sugar transferase (PEP-CTERM/EpsH1 system associated)
MRLLVVTTELPFPPTWGAAIRNFQFLKHLARRHQTSLLTYGDPEAAGPAQALTSLGITVNTVPPRQPRSKRLAQLASVLSSRSHLGRSAQTAQLQEAADELLARQRVDIVLLESSLVAHLRVPTGIPVVLDEHNIEYEVLQRTYQTETSPLRKVFGYLEYLKFRREEQTAWRQMDRCVFTSKREQALVNKELQHTQSAVVPNGVDVDYFVPSARPVNPDSVVFSGRIGYRPNTDAVVFFAREVLPLILSERPQTVFTVLGAEPPREVYRLAGANVVVTGRVADVRPYCQRAAVLVAPIRFGGGTRLKVLESLAMAKPLVSTSMGCEGIDVRGGEHLLLADSPAAIAAAVLQLLDDRDLAEAIGRRGRALVESRYSWPLITDQLEAVLTEAVVSKLPAVSRQPEGSAR